MEARACEQHGWRRRGMRCGMRGMHGIYGVRSEGRGEAGGRAHGMAAIVSAGARSANHGRIIMSAGRRAGRLIHREGQPYCRYHWSMSHHLS